MRNIEHFFGDSLVIGCGDNFKTKLTDILAKVSTHTTDVFSELHHLHGDKNNFYTLDVGSSLNPDLVVEIPANYVESPLLNQLKSRFNFILLELLPADSYLASDRLHEHYRSPENNFFANHHIENMIDTKGGILLIKGGIPSDLNNTLNSQIYAESSFVPDKNKISIGFTLFIVGPKGVDPCLIFKSLNKDAQAFIVNAGFKQFPLERYDIAANQQFLKDKALQMIDRQISRLKNEFETILADKSIDLLKKNKLTKKQLKQVALKKLTQQINTHFPNKSISDCIDNIKKEYPDLTSGIFSKVTKSSLDLLLDMEIYHLECCQKMQRLNELNSTKPGC